MLGVLLGTLAFLVALIARKRGCAMKLLVFPVLILLWLLMASIPPNAEAECERLFGPQVRQSAKHIQSWEPLGMDGFLLSIEISPPDFACLIKPSFSMQPVSAPCFLRHDSRPEDWPPAVENLTESLHRDVGEDDLRIYYDNNHQRLYAVFHYWGW
jgi:hypothetical protein